MLVPKPGKNPEECSLYRPISLLNVDAKISAKANLSKVLVDIIHVNQTRFMLFLNLLISHENSGRRVTVSLDVEKAFDWIE